ncbi:MAG TPA: thioredoxin domain-containing protein [Candidatus Paceibacterota bacterium]|nr:thioredoxin domain-containing protein [Candidatus Paceibacterota bacterium]
MNKNTIWPIVILALAIVAVAAAALYLSQPKTAYSQETLRSFALCLADKKLTMYGAEWCPHCKAQKALFGAAFAQVPYVECPQNEQLCIDKGIRGYPTWIDASGAKYESEQPLEKLAQVAGCPLGE